MTTKAFTVGEFKARFSEALQFVEDGGTVTVTYGRRHRPVAILTAPPKNPPPQRKLGMFADRMEVSFAPDWKMTEEEFLGE